MGVVKYTGPMASFHCPTNAEIRSLKVHFSPKQEGSGDPSPENVREIVGWDGVEVEQSGINLFNPNTEWFVQGGRYYSRFINNDTALFRMDLIEKNTTADVSGCFIGFALDPSNIELGYCWALRNGTIRPVANRTNRAGTKPLQYLSIYPSTIETLTKILARYEVRIVLNDVSETAPFKPYQGFSTTNYEFGVLGKNKFPAADGALSDCYLRADTTYTLSATSPSAGYFKGWYEDGTDTGSVWINEGSDGDRRWRTYVPEKDIIKGTFFLSTGMSECQLELGSTATTYEPYDPNKTVYGGWVDLITGEVASTYIHCKIKDLPGEWNYRSGNIRFQITLTDDYANATSSNAWTHFATSEVYKTSTSNGYGNKQIATYIDKHIYIRDDDFEGDVEAFLNGVGDTYITYELAEPTTYFLSPTSMQTFLAQNNVWSNADYVEVEYDLHETQDILARKQFIMANQPHVESASGAIASFETDLVAPLKECKVGFKPVQDLHGYDRPWVGGSGKNLFNINATEQNPSDTTAANTTLRIFTAGTYAVGTSWSNWWQPNQIISYSINNNILTIQNNNVYGIGFAFKLTPENTYTISATSTNGGISVSYYDVNGNYITTTSSNMLNTAFTVPAEANMTLLTFYSRRTSETATFANIQLELGSTATSYEPYENICPIEGWNELELYLRGVNLQDEIWEVGQINNTTGKQLTSTDSIVTTNYLPVPMNTDLRIVIPENTSVKVAAYDKNKQFLNYLWRDPQNLYTKKLNQCYLKLQMHSTYGLTYNNDISLNYSTTETAYKPYQGTTIPITFPATVNLFNEQWEQGNIEVGNNAGSSTCMRTDFIDVNSSTSYYLYTPRENNVFVFEYLEDGTYADKVNSVHTSHTFTTGSTTKKIRIVDRNSGTETVNTGINYPATITYYESYGTIYGGYVDLVTGEVWVEWKYIDLTTADWTQFSVGTSVITVSLFPGTISSRNNGFCNILPMVSNPNVSGIEGVDWNRNRLNLCLSVSREITTLADFKAWLQTLKDGGITPCVVAKYDEPTLATTLTPTQLKTLRGTNNIWSNSNGNIQVQFWEH